MPEKVFDLLEEMDIEPNQATLATLFRACAQVGNGRAFKIGKEFLNNMPNHFHNNNILVTSIINMLMKFGDVQSAEKLFEMIKEKDIVAYGAMMKDNLMRRIESQNSANYI